MNNANKGIVVLAVYWLALLLIGLGLVCIAGCSNAGTSDQVKVGYGPPVVKHSQGPTIIECQGEFEAVAKPDGTVSINPKGGQK